MTTKPKYIVSVEDTEGHVFEVDILSSDPEELVSIRPFLSEKCKLIQDQIEDYDDLNVEWLQRAQTALKRTQYSIKTLDRQVKYLTDPKGELSLRRNELAKWHTNNKNELEALKHYLKVSYPEAFEDWALLIQEVE